MMNVVIVGAGPVGLLQSLYLLKYKNEAEVGFVLSEMSTITIFERRSKQDLFGNNNNRSINLALSWRGMKTLEEVGLLEEVLKYCVPIRGRYIHPIAGKEYINLYSSQPNEVIFPCFVTIIVLNTFVGSFFDKTGQNSKDFIERIRQKKCK